MNRKNRSDLDLVHSNGGSLQFQEVALSLGWKVFVLDEKRKYLRYLWKTGSASNEVVDIAPLQGHNITEDLSLRDCTVNAMAVHVTATNNQGFFGRLWDPYGGLDDLECRRIQPVSWANLKTDPLRMLRLVRLAQTHELQLTAEVLDHIKINHSAVREASGERVREEGWRMLLQSSLPLSQGIEVLVGTELSGLTFGYPFPDVSKCVNYELPRPSVKFLELVERVRISRRKGTHWFPCTDVSTEALAQIELAAKEQLSRPYSRGDWWFRLALQALTLLSNSSIWEDQAKFNQRAYQKALPAFWQYLEAHLNYLAFSNLEARHCQNVLRCLNQLLIALRSGQMDLMGPLETHRLIVNSGYTCGVTVLIDAMVLLGLALHTSGDPPGPLLTRFQNWQNKAMSLLIETNFRKPQPLASGTELQEWFHLPPGPKVGQLLVQLLEAEACRKISTKREARSYIETLL